MLGFDTVDDYVGGKLDWLAAGRPFEGWAADRPRAGTVARADVPTCSPDEDLDEVRARARNAGWEACVVVNEQRIVLGLLRRHELAREGVRVDEAMRPGPSTFRPHVPIEEMADHMMRHDLPNSPITTSDGRLVGLLVREDAIQAAHALHADHHEGHDHG
jgi:CBS domain-containing protein